MKMNTIQAITQKLDALQRAAYKAMSNAPSTTVLSALDIVYSGVYDIQMKIKQIEGR